MWTVVGVVEGDGVKEEKKGARAAPLLLAVTSLGRCLLAHSSRKELRDAPIPVRVHFLRSLGYRSARQWQIRASCNLRNRDMPACWVAQL